MKEKLKNRKGVTIVSLIVTIIVLIILAGISINLVLGENGILNMAKKAKENTELAKVQEQENFNSMYDQIMQEGGTSEVYKQIENMTTLKEERGTTGGSLNVNVKTITYTFTQDDINKNYNFFVLFSSSAGASNMSHSRAEIVSMPEGAISYYNEKRDENNTIIVKNSICIIPTKNLEVGSQISVEFRGVYTFYIAGVK